MTGFNQRLQFLIDLKKTNQKGLAKAIGVHTSQISKWLSAVVGTPRRSTLQRFADYFGCDINWLANGEGEPFPNQKTETTEHIGEFERRKTDKAMIERLARMERAVFKTQCPGYFDHFFDFIAEEYGANREGVEKFLEEFFKDNAKFQRWDSEKKRHESSGETDPVEQYNG
jgi:transcriptional regulator with XRE-family HTH domain